ncbi:hypothetical protein ACFQL1_22830 [Halomicroarcula sp. GCM10025709]|uniref:hypothetical protein n=1 Tax=Halomicroarcula sp. GCM10025709 TaxID=3252669 RepID=UPI003622A8CC
MSGADLLDTDSENAVVVALDHGIAKGALDGFEDPRRTLAAVLAGVPTLSSPARPSSSGSRT